jgi:hypothetical protein
MEKGLEEAPEGPFQIGYPWKGMIQQCKKWANNMKWAKFPEFWKLDKDVKGSDGKSVRDAVCKEIVESCCYTVRAELQSPFDPSMWCPIARDLVFRLSEEIGLAQLLPHGSGVASTNKQKLLSTIFSFASDAVKEIRSEAAAYKDRYTRLDFSSGVPNAANVCARHIGSLRKKCFEFNTMDPKGAVSALADLLAYFDCMYLAEDHFLSGNFFIPVAFDKRFLMMIYKGFKVGSKLSSLPRSIDDGRKGNAVVNEAWYIMWQVIHVVHIFGRQYFPGATGSPDGYSLEKLCEHLGFDLNVAQKVIDRGVIQRTIWERPVKPPKQHSSRGQSDKRKSSDGGAQKKEAKKQKKDTSKFDELHSSSEKRMSAMEIWQGVPDEPLEGGWPEGWTKKVFERQGGATKGGTDRYWFSPKKQYRFRSMREVQKYLGFVRMLGTTEADEETAWRMFKGKQQ